MPGEAEPYKNRRTPIISSIATLRAVSDIPITVLDLSDSPQNWGHFPDLLKFTVERCVPALLSYHDLLAGWKHLSRIFDVRQRALKKNCQILYVDSDVFFFRDPFPLEGDQQKFCFDGFNSGLFYFDPSSPGNQRFFEIFQHYTMAAIYGKELRTVLRRHVGYDSWYGVWDEMILTYMKVEHPELFSIIRREEHCTAATLKNADPKLAKAFHCNGAFVRDFLTGDQHSRGLLCLIAQEFYDNLCRCLKPDDLRLMFKDEHLRHYLPRRFSLLANFDKVATVNEGGAYFMEQLLPHPHVLF